MKKKFILLAIATVVTAYTAILTSCGSKEKEPHDVENVDDLETCCDAGAQDYEYTDAQLFVGSRTKVNMYYLGTKRISPDLVKVEFDLVNCGTEPCFIAMGEGKATVEGKSMPVDEINVNGWFEKKRDYQYETGEHISFVTPDEWRPSMQPGDTYHCYMIFKIPSDVNCINVLSISYSTSSYDWTIIDSATLRPVDII